MSKLKSSTNKKRSKSLIKIHKVNNCPKCKNDPKQIWLKCQRLYRHWSSPKKKFWIGPKLVEMMLWSKATSYRLWDFLWIYRNNSKMSPEIKRLFRSVIKSYGRGRAPFLIQAVLYNLGWKASWENSLRKSSSSKHRFIQRGISS